MAVHVLAGGVGDNVCSKFEGAAQQRRGKGVVHHQGNSMAMGNGSVAGNIQHRQGGIGNGLPENQAGIVVKQGIHLVVGHPVVDIAHLNAHACQGDGQQIDGTAIDIVHCNQVLPGGADIEHRQQIGALAGGDQHGPHAALQVCQLFLHRRQGGIGNAGIHMPLCLQIKELP